MSLLKKTDLEVSSAICKLIPGNEEISGEKSDWSWRQKWGKRRLAWGPILVKTMTMTMVGMLGMAAQWDKLLDPKAKPYHRNTQIACILEMGGQQVFTAGASGNWILVIQRHTSCPLPYPATKLILEPRSRTSML